MQNRLIFSIREVFTTYLQSGEKFVIPPYQRGYKWGSTAIQQLLDDVYDFKYVADSDEFYCLQNITIVERKRKKGDNNSFIQGYNVIDGQQRLTTALIILSCLLDDEQIVQFKDKLKYDIREKSEEFLQKYILGKDNIHNDWDDFLNAYPLEDYNHQDIYYLYTARKTVETWLQQKESYEFDTRQFAQKFLDRVKFIVNLPDVINENDLFSNLNGNKVNLDGADLLRAIIITRVQKNHFDFSYGELKQVVLLNEQRARIGIELDRINQWWQDENKQRYFRILTRSLKQDNSINIKFEDEIYPIDILYKLFLLRHSCQQDDKLSLLWFENYFKRLDKDLADNSAHAKFYNELLDLQRLIEDFYEDKIIYHLLMYTHIYGGLKWKDFVDKWYGLNSRVAFYEWLKDCVWKIIHTINLDNKNHISEESTNSKGNIIRTPISSLYPNQSNIKFLMSEDFWSNGNLPMVCILIDIIDILGEGTDLPSLKAEYFSVRNEDKEHIFPQTPIEKFTNNKTDHERQIDKLNHYIEIVKKYLNKQEIQVPQDLSSCQNIETWPEEVWNTKINEINTAIKQVIPIGSLGNMCLLDGYINKSYGNDFFTEKRFDIIHKSRSTTFIRPHVLDAFDKSFANNDQRSDMSYMSEWTIEDIFLRRQSIINQINKFLK